MYVEARNKITKKYHEEILPNTFGILLCVQQSKNAKRLIRLCPALSSPHSLPTIHTLAEGHQDISQLSLFGLTILQIYFCYFCPQSVSAKRFLRSASPLLREGVFGLVDKN